MDTNVLIRWNETSETWEFTNDGSSYQNIATVSDIQGVVTGGSNTNITVASNGSVVDFSVATATAATLGVASFNSTEFTVTGGAVSITAGARVPMPHDAFVTGIIGGRAS